MNNESLSLISLAIKNLRVITMHAMRNGPSMVGGDEFTIQIIIQPEGEGDTAVGCQQLERMLMLIKMLDNGSSCG